MQYKLIALDLDGTFLDEKRRIPIANKNAVLQLQQMGVKIVFCSGRSYLSIDQFIKPLCLNHNDEYIRK